APESWDTNGTSSVWVQVPRLTGAGTCIYARWGGSDIRSPAFTTNGATWSEGYEVVYHFNRTNVLDSTANRRHGDGVGLISPTNGAVSGGLAFGGDNTITITDYKGVTGDDPRSVTAWARTTADNAAIASWGGTFVPGTKWTFRVQDNHGTAGAIRIEVESGHLVHDRAMNDGRWHHTAVSLSGGNVEDARLYLDGVAGASSTNGESIYTYDSSDVRIANNHNNLYYDGELDEVRISSVARSSNWIWAVWMNSASNAEFNAYSVSSSVGSITNLPATDLGDTSARLHGAAEVDGRGATVDVFWGPFDGGTNAGAWANTGFVTHLTEAGSTNFSFDVTNGLAPGFTNYFTFRLTRCGATNWATPSRSESLVSFDFPHAVKIRFCGYDRSETLTNFPALVLLDTTIPGFDYATFRSASGGDLRFISGDGTRVLTHEIESWNTAGTSRVWVRVAEMVDDNTCIFAKWGGAATNHPAYTTNGATWAEGYEAVWHFNTTNVVDSTRFGRDGINAGSVGSASGPVGQALAFDGASEVDITGYKGVTGTLDRTVTAWVRTSASDGTIADWGIGTTGNRWTFRISGGGQIRAEVSGGAIIHDRDLRDGMWHHTAVSWSAHGSPNITNGQLYADGILGRGFTFAEAMNTASSRDVQLGKNHADQRLLGDLDEVRISSVVRSSNWIWAVWMNSGSNAAFNCYESISTGNVDLAIAKSVDAVNLISGTNLTYTITVSNLGSAAAANVVVTDALPAAVHFISALPAPDTIEPGLIAWSLGALEAGC
ncbi:MAG: LamG-like jellyroll fold domain-containing protein, partial [Verrucomicrobiota bacterium]